MTSHKQITGQYLINEVSEITKLPKKTIRFYEKKELIPPVKRNPNGYRVFSRDDIRKLLLIKKAKNLDISLNEIKQVVDLAFNKNCHSFEMKFLQLIEVKKAEVDATIKELTELKEELIDTENYFSNNHHEFSSNCNAKDCDSCTFIDE